MDRRHFLLGAGALGAWPAVPGQTQRERARDNDTIVAQLATEAALVLGAIQLNGGVRSDHARRLASLCRLAAAANLDARLTKFYARLREDQALQDHILDTDELPRPADKKGWQWEWAASLRTTRAERVLALQEALSNGIGPSLLRLGGDAQYVSGRLARLETRPFIPRLAQDSTCLVLAIDTAVFSIMATGLGYIGTGASVFFVGAAAPEAVLIFAILAVSSTLIGKIAC